MAKLLNPDDADSFTFGVYDESVFRDEQLLWLVADEDPALPEEPVQGSGSLIPDAHEVFEPEVSVQQAEKPVQEISSSPDWKYQNTNTQLFASGDSVDCAPGVIGSSPLTDKLFAPSSPMRALLRVAAVVGILLVGTALPSILERVQPGRVKASPGSKAPTGKNQSASDAKSGHVRVLTVMVGHDDSIKGIGVRYAGHADEQMIQEIRKLNPDVKDFDHLEDGQIVRVPIRAVTPVQ